MAASRPPGHSRCPWWSALVLVSLVGLVGFCTQGDERLLVYKYMPFASLESHLLG